ncbi:MAG: hypothetical protein WCG63_01925 [Opitutaceae bacterium]
MTTNNVHCFVRVVALWFFVARAHAKPATIAPARDFIGDKSALCAVRSLRFVGPFVTG